MSDDHARVFNSDLLLNGGEVEISKQVYAAVGDVLDWPRLRDVFKIHDQAAVLTKQRSRRGGIQALALALIALWLAALEPRIHEVLPEEGVVWVLSGAVGAFALAGLVLGSGVLFGERKERWLHSRTASERLRQLHFQFLVRRATQFAAADPAVVAEAFAERERALDLLEYDMREGVTRPVEAIISDLGGADCWLVPERRPIPSSSLRRAELADLFEAYAKLRFRHQTDYAMRKLAQGIGLWPWEPKGQAQRIEQASYSLALIVVICHLLAVVVITLPLPAENWIGPTIGTIGLLGALGVLALRVLEDGLRPRAEVGRLQIYRGEVTELLRKFEAEVEPGAKLTLMERLEELSYRELRDFLALHDEASFVL